MSVSQEKRAIQLSVNGIRYKAEVETRLLLSDFLRHKLRLTGTHVSCEHGVCGACTVLLHGAPIRSCLMLAVQANGCELLTVEGLTGPDGTLHPIQQALQDYHGLQCGFCTPGFLMTIYAYLQDNQDTPEPDLSDEAIRQSLAGNLCRCTGYQGIVSAVRHLLTNARSHTVEPTNAHLSATQPINTHLSTAQPIYVGAHLDGRSADLSAQNEPGTLAEPLPVMEVEA